MATVRNLTERQKMNRTAISDKPCLPSFAKAKEKQRYPQANASASHLLLLNAQSQFQLLA